MKLYIVVHENASGPKDSVDTKLYLTEDAAEEGIYQEWTALMTEMGILDDYFSFDGLRNDCKSMKKITWNGKVVHRWEINEQNLDIEAIIKVKGGMVQSVIANADVSVEVYDLDVSSYSMSTPAKWWSGQSASTSISGRVSAMRLTVRNSTL